MLTLVSFNSFEPNSSIITLVDPGPNTKSHLDNILKEGQDKEQADREE